MQDSIIVGVELVSICLHPLTIRIGFIYASNGELTFSQISAGMEAIGNSEGTIWALFDNADGVSTAFPLTTNNQKLTAEKLIEEVTKWITQGYDILELIFTPA